MYQLKIKKKKKLLEESTRVHPHGVRFAKGFLDMTQKAGAAEEEIENLDFIKIKNFCASKDIIKKMQRQPRK